MSLQSIARDAFTAIKAAAPESVVAVISGEQTANGIKDIIKTDADLLDAGERGMTTGIVRIDAGEITEPARGASITVAGDPVFVTQTRVDSCGAILVIEYSKQRPQE